MESEILKTALDSGAAIFLAVVVIWFYRKDSQARVEESRKWAADCKECQRDQREDKKLVISTLQANTEALTGLRDAVRVITRNGKESSHA